MSTDDKMAEQGRGHARQGQGEARRRHRQQGLEAEGKADQSKADLKQAGEKVKDAFKTN